ncbi:MAG: thermonuclease family protein [Actinomycetota bacterium]
MSGKSLLASLVVIGALFAACNNDDEEETAAPTTASAAPTTTQSAPSYARATPVAAPAEPGEQFTVAEVIDGDTFTTTDGRTIRLLGVDSCEVGTYGGDAAKSITESQLSNQYN